MRPAHVTVPLAALAAVLTRLPGAWLGAAAALLAAAWTAATFLAPGRPRLHAVGPALALALLALPTAPDALLPLPGLAVGLAVGLAALTALPPRHGGVGTRPGPGAWVPVLAVTVVLAVPLLLPALVGPDRLGLMVDRTAPAMLAVLAASLAAAAAGYVLLTRREATA